MQHDITTSISISAPPMRVWEVLLDFARYPEWNPFVRTIEGPSSEGSTLRVTVHPPGGNAMAFRPLVLRHDVCREFRWKGRLLLPGVFDGEHFFTLSQAGDGSTLFTHGEHFSGFLVPFFRSALDRKTKGGFEAMNRALKQRIEGSGAKPGVTDEDVVGQVNR